jgi:cytochrome-b5 reductase
MDVKELSHDTKLFRLDLGGTDITLGLPIGKHIIIYSQNPQSCIDTGLWNGKPDADNNTAEIQRKYTPTTGDETLGYVDIVVKVYKPGTVKMPDGREMHWADGGKGSLNLHSKKPGDYIDVNGPVGVHEYLGRGTFKMPGRVTTVKHVGMMAGGTGLTPMLQIIRASLRDPLDQTRFTLIYANKTEDDILCKDMLEEAAEQSKGRFILHYTLDFAPSDWPHKKGFITEVMIKECLPPPAENTMILMCGPPPMIELACKKNLDALGYKKELMATF